MISQRQEKPLVQCPRDKPIPLALRSVIRRTKAKAPAKEGRRSPKRLAKDNQEAQWGIVK
jgi:hypothetical protein